MKQPPLFPKLLRQALRRLLMPGLILLGAALVISQLSLADGSVATPTGAIAIAAFGTLALTFTAFSFLRTRRAGDFYHSIPVGRTALYWAHVAAVLIWAFGIIIVDFALYALVDAVTSTYRPELAEYMVVFLITIMIGLQFVAATTLVSAATGTLSASVLITGVLLLLPTLIVILYQTALADATGGVLTSSIYSMIDDGFLLIAPVAATRIDGEFFRLAAVSLGISLLYFMGGWALFVRRKSEMAGHGAATTWMHHICRIVVTIPFVAFIPVQLVHAGSGFEAAMRVVILLCAASVAYFGYELLTTRRLASVIKAAPLFFVVIAIAVLASGGLLAAKAVVLSYRPTAEQVSSIKLRPADIRTYDEMIELGDDYHLHLISQLPIMDDRAQQIICQALERRMTPPRGRAAHDFETVKDGRFICAVTIKSGASTRKRVVGLFSQELRDILLYSAETDAAICEVLTALPQQGEGVRVATSGKTTMRTDAELYETFCREFAALTVEQMCSLNAAMYGESWGAWRDTPGPRPVVYVAVEAGPRGYARRLKYYVSPTLTPKTYALFLTDHA